MENFWRHSVGTAILTREILAIAEHKADMEADYISGLLHNLGIIIQAITFPDEFELIYAKSHQTLSDLTDSEENYIDGIMPKWVPTIYGIITFQKT